MLTKLNAIQKHSARLARYSSQDFWEKYLFEAANAAAGDLPKDSERFAANSGNVYTMLSGTMRNANAATATLYKY